MMKNNNKELLLKWVCAGFALFALIILLIPMGAIAKYDVPISDDYAYGQFTARIWNETHRIGSVIQSAFKTMRFVYLHWQGSYTATFLMSLEPGIFGIHSYFWTFIIMTLFLLTGIWCLVHTICKHVIKQSIPIRLILFATISILCTQFLPNPLEAFFWFNGASYYTLCFSVALMMISVLIAYLYRTPHEKNNMVFYCILPIFAFLLAGGNYSTGLQLILILIAFLIKQFCNKKTDVLLIITLAVFIVMFIVNIKCPANSARQYYSGLTAFVRAGVKSVIKTAASIANWTNLPILLLAGVMIPIAVDFCRVSEFRFRFPLLVLMGSFFFIASGYMPTLYTQDYTGSGRLLDIQYFLYILLLFTNIFYVSGWLYRRLLTNIEGNVSHKTLRDITVGFCIMLVVSGVGSYSSFTAYKSVRDLVNGTASAYFEEQKNRWSISERNPGQDLVLEPLSNLPELLIDDDLGESIYNWKNEVFAMYFQLNTVRVDHVQVE